MGSSAVTVTVQAMCPLCGRGAFRPWDFDLLQCVSCQLVLARHVWRRAANEELNEAYFGGAQEPVTSSWVRLFEAWNNRRTLTRLRRRAARTHNRLLEVGVGSGSFLAAARQQGFAVTGCDLSSAVCRRVERETGIPMHCGTLETLPPGTGFDVVVMNHILEHVAEPLALLRAAHKRLNPNGVLHLTVPNVGSWEARLRGWNCYVPYHLVYFDPRTLRAAAEQTGFEVCLVTTHESFSGWFLAILRTLWTRNAGSEADGPSSVGRKPHSAAVANAYRLAMVIAGMASTPLRALQALIGRGDEVVLLGRRRPDVAST